MKLLATPVLCLCFLLAGCAENASEPDADIMNASNKVEADVSGMDCEGCSSGICSAVKKIEGVSKAYADVKTGKVVIALEDNADADAAAKEIETVIAGLDNGKYTISNVKASNSTNENKPEKENEQTEPDAQTQAPFGETNYVASYKVQGMDCSGCSSSVQEAVAMVADVKDATADHKTGIVLVAFEQGDQADARSAEIKQLIAGLSDGKYTVGQEVTTTAPTKP